MNSSQDNEGFFASIKKSLFGSSEETVPVPVATTLSGGGSRSRSRSRRAIKKEKNYYKNVMPSIAPVQIISTNTKVTRSGRMYGGKRTNRRGRTHRRSRK